LCLSQNQIDQALQRYKEIIDADPENGPAYLCVGNVHARLGRFDKAQRAYQKVIQLAPARPEGYRALAQFYLRANRNLPEAKTAALKLVEVAPVAANYFLLGDARERPGDRPGAVAAVARAVELDPENAEYRRVLKMIQKKE